MARYRLLRLMSIALVFWLGSGEIVADEFSVDSVKTFVKDETLYLDANVAYRFTDTVLEALDNGVPLTLDVHIQVRRVGAWLWEERLTDRHLRYLIRHQALSELYQVVGLSTGGKTNFVTRKAAVTALGEIVAVPLIEREKLDPGEAYEVRIKVDLDIEALPLPLRPLAYLKPSWNLSSEWTKWPLKQ